MKKPVVFYTIADDKNKEYADKMVNSLRKFHPDIPHVLFGQEELDKWADPSKFYRFYAIFGEQLSKEYELVINIDADSIVCGDLSHIIDDKSYEIGGVLNNNEIDPKITLFNIPYAFYLNAGFLAVRSERFWPWWAKMNYTAYFDQFQYREQDMLNIIFHYGDFKTKIFDFSDKWHGLIHKGYWNKFELRGDKIFLSAEEGVCDEDKEIKAIHWAGGNVPNKMNIHAYFKPAVVERLVYLMGDEK